MQCFHFQVNEIFLATLEIDTVTCMEGTKQQFEIYTAFDAIKKWPQKLEHVEVLSLFYSKDRRYHFWV